MIKAANVAKRTKVISKQNLQKIEKFDKLLPVFIDDKQLKEDSW